MKFFITDCLLRFTVEKVRDDKAREVYNKLLARNPDDPQIQLSVCDFLIGEKNYNELFLLLILLFLIQM